MDSARTIGLCLAVATVLAPLATAHVPLPGSTPSRPSTAAASLLPSASPLPPALPAAERHATCTPAPSGDGAVISFFKAPEGTTVACGPIQCRTGLIVVAASAASGGLEARGEGPCIPGGAPAAVSMAPVPDAEAFALLIAYGAFWCVATALQDGTWGTATCGDL
ncbi:MAG TPA: hypothetical protein VHI93_04095 [Candidatus Thermoplasmatota archaeon]|nr:hypothetical protein [Candidatus Thermoplasmatota archaeon]